MSGIVRIDLLPQPGPQDIVDAAQTASRGPRCSSQAGVNRLWCLSGSLLVEERASQAGVDTHPLRTRSERLKAGVETSPAPDHEQAFGITPASLRLLAQGRVSAGARQRR
jgi:hypothetical protein